MMLTCKRHHIKHIQAVVYIDHDNEREKLYFVGHKSEDQPPIVEIPEEILEDNAIAGIEAYIDCDIALFTVWLYPI